MLTQGPKHVSDDSPMSQRLFLTHSQNCKMLCVKKAQKNRLTPTSYRHKLQTTTQYIVFSRCRSPSHRLCHASTKKDLQPPTPDTQRSQPHACLPAAVAS